MPQRNPRGRARRYCSIRCRRSVEFQARRQRRAARQREHMIWLLNMFGAEVELSD
jgi:hypothetical protein